MIDAETIKMLRDLATAATPSTVHGMFRSDERDEQIAQFAETLDYGSGKCWVVCAPVEGKPIEEEALYSAITGNGSTSEANAKFYAHARHNMLLLLDEIEILNARKERA